jgi:hypothetical protein
MLSQITPNSKKKSEGLSRISLSELGMDSRLSKVQHPSSELTPSP